MIGFSLMKFRFSHSLTRACNLNEQIIWNIWIFPVIWNFLWSVVVGARKGWDLCDCCCYFPSQCTSKNQTVAKNWFHGHIGQRDCRWMDEVDERHLSPEQVFVRQIAQPKMLRPTGDSCKFELNVPSRSEVDLRRGSQEELSVQELKAICQDKCTILQTVTLKWCVSFPSAD